MAAEYAALVRHDPAFRAPLPPWSLERVDELQERFLIAATVLSVSHTVFAGDQGLANELARAINEEGARITRAGRSRYAALATLPLPDVQAALDELGHALDTLQLDGVLLHTNVDGTYLGEARFQPLLDELNRRAAYVLIHPTEPPGGSPQAGQFPPWVAEFPFETTRAALSLLYTGTLARCPEIRFQLSHAGGALPFLAPRIASLEQRESDFDGRPGGSVRNLLGNLYYDTGLANHASVLHATLAVAQPGRIVFGTDWPYAALPQHGDDPAPDLDGLSVDCRLRLETTNAAALIPRWNWALTA